MAEKDHYKYGMESGRKIDPSIAALRKRVRTLEAALTEIANDLRYMAAWDIARKALDREGEHG